MPSGLTGLPMDRHVHERMLPVTTELAQRLSLPSTARMRHAA